MSTLLDLRRRLVSAPLMAWCRRILPPISETERDALEAGTVWWDGELFSGKPDWQKLRTLPRPGLTDEEQAFLDGPVEQLCNMADEWQINEQRDLPPEIWRFIREQGFLGMIIPKQHGGLGFSAQAHSAVVMKVSTRSITTAISIMVPNSLGPAELLLHYGTEQQKDYYLPRLAKGEELPCFALTGPWAGSDAAAMRDYGTVCYSDYQGKRTLGIRLNWEKRYITLAPVATLLGLAFKLTDPDHLLGDDTDLGITLALIPTDTDGIEIGRRHYPVGQAFQNGPTVGRDVFIPLDWVIGGRDGVSRGWRMLMDCLAAGRSISLPSLGTGAIRYCARMSGTYARIRRQFKVAIGDFEGIQEPLARMAGNAYLFDAARALTAQAVDQGEKPSVLSAILKYHATERQRESVDDAMDIHGGRGICIGPSNYLFHAYQGTPVAITVEGANILTRSLIIFGQGAIRCHPYLLDEMQAASDPDRQRGLKAFDRALFGHLGFMIGNFGRTLGYGLTGGQFIGVPDAGRASGYYRRLAHTAARFALIADLSLLSLGGALKRRELLSARFGDILSGMYLLSAAVKRFEDDGCPETDLPLLDYVFARELHTVEQRFGEILTNLPLRPLAWLLHPVLFPFGRRQKKPDDSLIRRCARLLTEPSEARDRLTAGIFIGEGEQDVTGRMEAALETVIAAEAVERKLKTARHRGDAEQAVAAGIISDSEARLLSRADQVIRSVIDVDDFAPEELLPNGAQTPQWQAAQAG